MIEDEAALERIMERIRETAKDSTVCLCGIETELLLKYIDELKERRNEHE